MANRETYDLVVQEFMADMATMYVRNESKRLTNEVVKALSALHDKLVEGRIDRAELRRRLDDIYRELRDIHVPRMLQMQEAMTLYQLPARPNVRAVRPAPIVPIVPAAPLRPVAPMAPLRPLAPLRPVIPLQPLAPLVPPSPVSHPVRPVPTVPVPPPAPVKHNSTEPPSVRRSARLAARNKTN